jgi:hypothetical protein
MQLLVEWLPQHKPVAWLLILGGVMLTSAVLLVWWERRCPNPVLPMNMLSDRHLVPLFLLASTLSGRRTA